MIGSAVPFFLIAIYVMILFFSFFFSIIFHSVLIFLD
jgi:hypothetical protein